MTAPIELQTGPLVEKKVGKTSSLANIASWLTRLHSQAMRSSLLSRRVKAETNGVKKKSQAETKTKAIQRNQKIQPHLACAASDTVHRLTRIRVPSQFSENVVRILNDAIVYHQGDNIVGARRSLRNLFQLLVINKAQCFDFPSKYGLEVLHLGRQLFLEKGVSCSIKHGTLLLDSSTSGAQFYSGLLNVMGAFALLISEFEIANGTFERLIDLHHQSNTTSRSRDLAAAYNNKGCVHLIMGDLLDAHKAFETSLRSLGNSNGSSNITQVFAVKSNMSRLNLVFRKYRQALEQQEKLVESCKATEMKDIPYPFEAVFTVMNNQAVLHTILGNFKQAEQALRWLISYCKEMDREDSVYLVIFIRLHLSEVLLLHGKSKEADEVFSIEDLNSLDDIVNRFGNLYMNVRIEALEKLLELYVRRGKVKAALGLLQTTVKILKTVFGPDHFNIASLLYKQGTILSLVGEFSTATEKLKSSVEILRKIFGFKNFLLLKCYMSLGDVTSRMNQVEESYLYFQRATENIEAIYQVSFVDELSLKYKEITRGFKIFQTQSVFDDRIEGLVAEYGHGMAFLLNHNSNGQLRKCRADRKPVTVKKMDGQFSESMSIVSFKYSSDFIKSGQKLLRLGMIKEAAVFFQYAELHCGVHVNQGYPNLGVARLHSIFLKEKYRCHETLKHDHRLRKFLEDLSSVIEARGAQSIVERIDGVVTTMEFDYPRNLRPVLILLLLFSIELKMIETTFVAYDLYSKLFQNESSVPFLLLDGIQVYASKAIITCNGETAVQDILISSQIGLKESDAENASTDTSLFHSLASKENATENAFLVTGRTPFLLDIEDLNTVKEKISLAVQECFQMKCLETEARGVATKVIVDLTPTAKCGLVLSMGSRIDLLPLCLSEHPNSSVPHKETIFEIDTSMHQRITGVTFKDEQTSCFMFKKVALRLLQQRDAGKISSMTLPHHSLSLTVLHPGKVRLNLSQSGKEIIQKIQFVTTRTKITGRANSNGALQASVLDAISLPEIYQTTEKYKVPCQKRTLSEAPSVQSVTLCETVDTSELEDRYEQTRDKALECLLTVSQISQRLCLADSNQCHNAYGSLEDEGYLSRMDDVDLGDDDTSYQVASSQNREHQENSTLQHLTESSEGKENNDGLTLNAHDCTTVEESTNNHEEESLLRADLCEILEGKRLFEEDRQSRRSFMADLQESLKKKQPDSEKGDSIQSNRAEVNDFSKLQSSQNDSKCGNLEVPHQNTKAQAPSGNLISRNVSNHENGQRISSHEGNTAKEEDKLMRIHQLPQGPALNNVKDRNDLDTEAKCELPGDVSSGLPKTTLVKEYRFTGSNESDSSSILERETYAKNVETARNDVFLSEQNAIKTNRETSRNQEVQGTIGVIQGDQEGQRQTKPGGNKFKSRKQHLEEESERSEVEIRGNRGNTPEKQETPCSDSELRSTISNRNESTIRSLCQGGDIVADGESLEELDKNAVAVDGSVLEKKSHNGIHAMIVMPNRAVQDAIAVDQRQTKPGVNKLEIREQHLVEDRERSGVEIIGNRSNTPEKQGTSCPDYDEMTTERTFVSPIEDGLRDGTKNKDTVRSQNDVVNLLRETYAADGPNLKEENETRSLKQSLGAIKLMDPYGQAHFKSRATLSNRHEITSRSMCHGCDVVADGGSRGDLINNVDTVDGPALTQNLHKDFYAGEKFKTSVRHKSVTLGGENESHTDALCKSRYPLEPKSNLFQSHSGDGGARPKQRSTDNTKTRLPRTSNKNPMSANSDLERIYPGLDPDFLARHVKEGSPLLPFHNGGNYNHASSDGLWQDYEQEYFSFNAQDQVFNSKDKKSHFMEEFIPRDKANRYDKVIPVYNALAALVPLNGKEKESWHFPPSESCKDMVLRNQCFAERTNESNPTSLPKSLDANRVKPFCTCGSAGAYKDMASMANDSSTSVGNDECGQSPPMSENEHSWTENALTANFRYLQEIMAKTIRLVALSATGAKENHPANQTVEKTGIQEETGDMGEAEATVTQRIYETNTQRESTPSNETTVEAERQPTATPVQESPRPVCSHYQRRCLVRFPCCGKFFPCHRCHNESDCSEDQARAVNATHIRCTICYHEQEIDENGQRCGGCNAIMSEYFCPTCRHYTSVDKNPFHCEKCGICRIHRDRSFHCDVCNVCLDKRLEGKHKCRPDSGHDECCICLEDAFSGCQILPCSHKVHKDCAIAMIQNGVRTCPICRHPLFGQLQNSTQ